jgi:dephospho-CoA kinase
VRLVGLTGGIAVGKTTVAAMFAARGAAVIDADRITHALQAPGSPCHAAILEAFGPGVATAAGVLDRRRLGDRVFADASARRRLEAIMHPAIWARVRDEAGQAEAAGRALCLVDAAVLFEAGWAERFAAVVLVVAPVEVQLARLAARGLAEADARRRLAAQWPAAWKAARADHVIHAGGSLADTEAQVVRVHAKLLSAE